MIRILFFVFSLIMFDNWCFGTDEIAFKIKNQSYTIQDIYKEDEYSFYKIEKSRYELIERLAIKKYLDLFWENLAKQQKVSVDTAKSNYFKKHIKVSDSEVNSLIEQYKDHPQIRNLSNKEKLEQFKGYLTDRKKQEIINRIINAAITNKELVVVYPMPKEPVFNIKIDSSDHVRYGPSADDINPLGCSKKCPITIVEFFDYECPFCARAIPTATKILSEYKGKIRWVVKDLPLSFHQNARSAAIAAHCAGRQKKFWHMYLKLFENQSNLSKDALETYAKSISGINITQWKFCLKNSAEEINKIINKSLELGLQLGVNGTPAYFINGKKIEGALPYESFKNIINEELSNKKLLK